MATVGKKYNPKDYEDRPTSKLSQHKSITKPENREMGTKLGTPEQANKALKKIHF